MRILSYPCVLLLSFAATSVAVAQRELPNLVSVSVIGAWRDTRDYDIARSGGLGGRFAIELSRTNVSTKTVALSRLRFEQIILPPPPISAGSRSVRVASAREGGWDPATQSVTSLDAWSGSVGYRRYLRPTGFRPFAAAELGLTRLATADEHAWRPTLGGAGGVRYDFSPDVGIHAQMRYDWLGYELNSESIGIPAKSPRWFVLALIGVSLRLEPE
jgi:hypothetical protein